ncbi:hypothetical protein [Novosphingobium sp. Leaf2]|uniref:hypothetical protein n=1 Tax=Novosphingobium sp. Leaf2 TaxID=1735670 RepID=UPI0012E149AE|nr:hypothetical protein [Novosphingobium sp. Leaf2]
MNFVFDAITSASSLLPTAVNLCDQAAHMVKPWPENGSDRLQAAGTPIFLAKSKADDPTEQRQG